MVGTRSSADMQTYPYGYVSVSIEEIAMGKLFGRKVEETRQGTQAKADAAHERITGDSGQAHDDLTRDARAAHTPCGHPRCELCNTG